MLRAPPRRCSSALRSSWRRGYHGDSSWRLLDGSLPVLLVQLNSAAELLIFVAYELDQFLIRQQPLIDAHRPRLGVRLRIFDREVDLQMAERRPAETLRDLRLARVRTAVHIQPTVGRTVLIGAAQVVCLDHQVVAVPVTDRISVPKRLRLALRRQLAPVHVDMA